MHTIRISCFALLLCLGTVASASARPQSADPSRSSLVGTDAAETLDGTAGRDLIRLRGGDDTSDAGVGNDIVFAGIGVDAIAGGDGNDVLFARARRDVTADDVSSDTVSGGAGNDVVFVRDGEADSVSCGDGRDVVVADTLDVVATDCELVKRRTPKAASQDDGASKKDAGEIREARAEGRRGEGRKEGRRDRIRKARRS